MPLDVLYEPGDPCTSDLDGGDLYAWETVEHLLLYEGAQPHHDLQGQKGVAESHPVANAPLPARDVPVGARQYVQTDPDSKRLALASEWVEVGVADGAGPHAGK